jgi:hypothetical protein
MINTIGVRIVKNVLYVEKSEKINTTGVKIVRNVIIVGKFVKKITSGVSHALKLTI